MGKQGKKKRIWLRVLLGILAALLLVIIGYVLYVMISYHRLPDDLTLDVRTPENADITGTVSVGTDYEIITYNIGFGAYTPDYSFFMDGGKSSVAASKESVLATVSGAGELAAGYDPDFMIFEEVDLKATRSYHVDEYELLDKYFSGYYSDFAINYDSAFLMVPPWEPHGKSLAGIAFYSKYPIASAVRKSFPISTSFSKFLDLDRCYSISRIPADNGKELVIFSLHMSAYGNSDAIREAQVNKPCGDMQAEYEKGNYVICGGDFNHDLKASEDTEEDRASWAYPFPRSDLPEGFSFSMDFLGEAGKAALPDSARNADMPYEEGVTYTVTLDGFIISDNIELKEYENIHTGYLYADHDPVRMVFSLK